MDAGITAAARALDAGDVIAALGYVAARGDAGALALRGIAMARLGELASARACLRQAALAFGADRHARARCTVARAEVELAMRDLTRPTDLAPAIDELERAGDARNAAWARLVEARRSIVLGRLDQAELSLSRVPARELPPLVLAVRSLTELEVALRRLDGGARAGGRHARAGALARGPLPGAGGRDRAGGERARSGGGARPLARRRAGRAAGGARRAGDVGCGGGRRLPARARLRAGHARSAHAAHPVSRSCAPSARRTRGTSPATPWPRSSSAHRRPDESHRVRLRVEVGRARALVRGLSGIVATGGGFRLDTGRDVVVITPPDGSEGADVLALVESGDAWTSASLAAALGCGVRRVQRALKDLEAAGRVRSHGRGRARNWSAPPRIASHLLLPGLLLMR